ncbi:MAG: hypothetical protein ACI9TH_002304 [Kiritimatiellia bacterium]|jgi:hypothetical protein
MNMKKLVILYLSFMMLGSAQVRGEESFTFAGGAETWGGERIPLPTSFAPDMKVSGIEEIRFAPGMFKPDSDEFFTYVFVFSCPEGTWNESVIQREILTYYRGLSRMVSKGQVTEEDAAAFTFALEAAEAAHLPGDAKSAKTYAGKLNWTEPFKTLKPQVLHMEIATWQREDAQQHYLFASVSPKPREHAIWKSLRAIRESLVVK